jgi:hypothetical protein
MKILCLSRNHPRSLSTSNINVIIIIININIIIMIIDPITLSLIYDYIIY